MEQLSQHHAGWKIRLDGPPSVRDIGIGMHGFHGNESYRLPLWCLHLYRYVVKLRIGDRIVGIEPGCAGIIAPELPTCYLYDSKLAPYRHIYVHFHAAGPPEPGLDAETLPVILDLGGDFDAIYARFAALIGAGAPRQARADAALWDTLWMLSERPVDDSTASAPGTHAAVALAAYQIEARLAEPISVAELASLAGVSYGYLSRLFRIEHGVSVVGYIRARRMQRALHLLRFSSMPIKAVAAAVGIPDLHLFNKTVRREYGFPPRRIRTDSGPL